MAVFIQTLSWLFPGLQKKQYNLHIKSKGALFVLIYGAAWWELQSTPGWHMQPLLWLKSSAGACCSGVSKAPGLCFWSSGILVLLIWVVGDINCFASALVEQKLISCSLGVFCCLLATLQQYLASVVHVMCYCFTVFRRGLLNMFMMNVIETLH